MILHEETGLYLTFSKQYLIRHTTVNKHFSEGITKIPVLHFLSFVTPQIQNNGGMLIRGEGAGVW